MTGATSTETIAVTVHGPHGSLDLVVPLGASASDVASEYAAQVGLPHQPGLLRVTGEPLGETTTLEAAGVESGDVLTAAFVTPPAGAGPGRRRKVRDDAGPSPYSPAPLFFAVAGGFAVLAGLVAAHTESFRLYLVTVDLLLIAAVIGVVPLGRWTDLRSAVAPTFAAAAAYATVWTPGEEALPLTFGIAALAAAVAAGAARAFGTGHPVVHQVWIIGGLTTFGVTGLCVVFSFPPQVPWSVLLVLALMATRSVPALAVDVPDQMLIDLERLAITAWSARDRPTGRRGRIVIRPTAITELLTRGSHIVNAAGVAVLAVVVVATPNLLTTARYDLDRPGALALCFFVGGGILLAARSYRHRQARVLMRCAGVFCWGWLAGHMLLDGSTQLRTYAVIGSLVLAAFVVLAAVATGRGWRSVWWARRAEIVETICGALALAVLVLSTGLFREVWELRSGG